MADIAFIDLEAQRARIASNVNDAVARVLDRGDFIMGKEVDQFESRLSDFCGAEFAITCANGTDALALCLMAENIGPGDAVVLPAFTFVATAEAVAGRLATPIFCDVDAATFNIDVESFERAVIQAKKSGVNPKAVISVDLFGLPADYQEVAAVAKQYDLVHIADAAQSFGATYGKERVGALADYTTTSFFPSKPLGCYGDGGAVLTNSADRAAVLGSLRVHGKGEHKYDNIRIGLNSRLDTIQAAILLQKMTIFEEELVSREEAAGRYNRRFSQRHNIPIVPDGRSSVWAQYTLRLSDTMQRAAVQASCREQGIPTAVYYPNPLHLQDCYKDFPRDPQGVGISERLSQTVLSLPMHPYLSDETQERVVNAVSAAT